MLKPPAVKWIIVLTWAQLARVVLFTVVAIVFIYPFQSPELEAYRRGFLRGAGYVPEQYGYGEAGEIAGAASVPIVPAIFLLLAVWRRNIIALRVIALLGVIFSLSSALALLLAIPTLILTFLSSTAAYCRRELPSAQGTGAA